MHWLIYFSTDEDIRNMNGNPSPHPPIKKTKETKLGILNLREGVGGCNL